jgi:hypothetical protein
MIIMTYKVAILMVFIEKLGFKLECVYSNFGALLWNCQILTFSRMPKQQSVGFSNCGILQIFDGLIFRGLRIKWPDPRGVP